MPLSRRPAPRRSPRTPRRTTAPAGVSSSLRPRGRPRSKTPSPFVVGVWAWPFADAPGLYPFLASRLDLLLARRLPHLLLCSASAGGALALVKKYAHVERL